MTAITAGTSPAYHGTVTALTAQSGASPSSMIDVGKWGGRMRVMHDTHTPGTTGTFAKDSFVTIGVLPKGARIWEVGVYISATMGSSKTLSVGYLPTNGTTAGDDVKFAAATAATSAGWIISGPVAAAGVDFELPEESYITLHHAGGSGASAAIDIHSMLTWVVD